MIHVGEENVRSSRTDLDSAHVCYAYASWYVMMANGYTESIRPEYGFVVVPCDGPYGSGPHQSLRKELQPTDDPRHARR